MIQWVAGLSVRLVDDVGTVGVCTGHTRARDTGTILVQVAFPGMGLSFQPDYELESVPESADSHYDLVQQGRYSRADHLKRCLTHIQLSGKLANLVYSMDTTNTDFYAYQFKPVLAFLESPSKGLLIADEVGLGKTIEAGLIWTEIRARYDARRLVVLCPAMLRDKWKAELAKRFGVDAELMNAEQLLGHLRLPREGLPDGKAVICSFQGTRPPKGWQEDGDDRGDSPQRQLAKFLKDEADSEPMIDLLIIDEAHYLRNPESLTHKISHLLREVSDHVVLLSATPINLSQDDLFFLLNIADPDTFRFVDYFPQILAQNEPLIRARELALTKGSTEMEIKDVLRQSPSLIGTGFLEPPVQSLGLLDILEQPFPEGYLDVTANRVELANRLERLNLLGHVLTRTRRVDVAELRTIRMPYTEAVQMTPAEDRFYAAVTEGIRDYAVARDVSDGFLLSPPQRQVSSCMVAAAKAWRARDFVSDDVLLGEFGGDPSVGVEVAGPGPLIEHLIRHVLSDTNIAELEASDSKYARLESILKEILREDPEEKIILFSYFRGTLHYLKQRLERNGINAQVVMGGMRESKQAIIDRFRESKDARVLLSSEVAAEGVDLQFSRVLINYDLPWNPMRVEQRIGRIDRIGQKSEKIIIWNLCAAGTIDERILVRLYQRLEIFKRALGGFEEILGTEIQALTSDLLSSPLTPQQEADRIDKSALAVANVRRHQEELEAEASKMVAHGGYVLQEVQAAHDFSRRISDRDIEIYVHDYLTQHAPGHDFHQIAQSPPEYELRLPPIVAARFSDFVKARRLMAQTKLSTGESKRCRFVNKVQSHAGAYEQISQFHPLVRFISSEIDPEIGTRTLVIAAAISQATLPTPVDCGIYAFAVKRWSFSGLRAEEELKGRVVNIETLKTLGEDESLNLINHVRVWGMDWLEAATAAPNHAVIHALDVASEAIEQDYRTESRRRNNENTDRIERQKAAVNQHLNRRCARLDQTIETHRIHNRVSLVKAVLAQKVKLHQKMAMQLEILEQKRQLARSQFDVCWGLVEIKGD